MAEAVVLDAGISIKAVMPDPLQSTCQALLGRWADGGTMLMAPDLWAYETTSTVTKAVHFKQLTPDEGRRALSRIAALGVSMVPPDPEVIRAAFEWTSRLHRAAAYDSFYLALAESLGCEFWTTDRRLVKAVRQPWVRLAGEEN